MTPITSRPAPRMRYYLPEGSSMLHLPDFYGCICQPRNRTVPLGIKEGRRWIYDNDCFHGGFNPWSWMRTLEKLLPFKSSCDFIVVPDVVGDAWATKRLWYEHVRHLLNLKLPLAFVAQNGQGKLDIPEHALFLFIGGDDEFKLGDEGKECVKKAKERGLLVHMGRVNSLKRLRYAKSIGCSSADGTYICFGKDTNIPKLTWMMRQVNRAKLPGLEDSA